MRSGEPTETVLVLLPGPAPSPVVPPPATAAVRTPAPTPAPAPPDTKAAAAVDEATGGPRPYMRHAAKVYPDDFEKDTLKYFQDRIGKITPDDVAEILGEPTRQRPAFSDDQKENGTIDAFADSNT